MCVAESAPAELFDQFWKARGSGGEVGVDGRPSCRRRPRDVLRAFAVFETLRVRQGVKGRAVANWAPPLSFQPLLLFDRERFPDLRANLVLLLIAHPLLETASAETFILCFS